MMKDAKYLIAYLLPLSAFLGLYYGGIWSLGAVYLGFGIIPLLEFFTPESPGNYGPETEKQKLKSRYFDWLLYLNVPILFGLLIYFFYILTHRPLTTFEQVGMTLNMGLLIGSIGINVAHELGHRSTDFEQFLSRLLLMTALYMHFNIEHNRGHHKNVATPEDPATAPYGQSLYSFWWQSITGSYLHAWQLEKERLNRMDLPAFHWKNQMIHFHLAELAYILAAGLIFGWVVVPYLVAAAVVGILLLESINYVEHYGLLRKRKPNGRYEKVELWHSWNSDHELGRIFLYELTRHSDHHYKASRKYQVLRHFDESPQLPFGYPSAILVALLPPLWYRIIHPRIQGQRS